MDAKLATDMGDDIFREKTSEDIHEINRVFAQLSKGKPNEISSLFSTTRSAITLVSLLSMRFDVGNPLIITDCIRATFDLLMKLESISREKDDPNSFFDILKNAADLYLVAINFLDYEQLFKDKNEIRKAKALYNNISRHIIMRNLAPTLTGRSAKALANMDELESRLLTLSNKANRIQSDISLNVESLSKHIEDRIQQTYNTVKSDVAEESARVNQKAVKEIARFTGEVEAAIDLNKAQIEESIQNAIAQISEFKTNTSSNIEEYASNASKLVVAIDDEHKRAKEIVGIISNDAMAGHYKQLAHEEGKIADRYRNFAICFMSFALLWSVGFTIYHIHYEKTGDIIELVLKMTTAFFALVPAGYLMAESSKHRASANINKKTELDIAALEPYIFKLPEDIQHCIKKDCATMLFGIHDKQQKDNSAIDITALSKMISMLVEKSKK